MNSKPITEFRNEYFFLSNFSSSVVRWGVDQYPTVEHAFQAAKTLSKKERNWVKAAPTPGIAKKRGQKVTLRKDWKEAKQRVMEILLRRKFKIPNLRQALIRTGDRKLVEGNSWGDQYWGVSGGSGRNRLGKLLMKIREELNGTK